MAFLLAATVRAQTANSWKKGSDGKWEVNGSWTAGAPSIFDAVDSITNANPKTVTIDASTPTNTLTISNLTVSANTLRLTGANATGLHVLNGFMLTNNGALLITNSTVQIDGGTTVGFPLFLSNAVPVDSGNITLLSGSLTLSNSLILGNPAVTFPGPAGPASLTVAGGTATMSGLFINDLGTTGVVSTVWVTGGALDVGSSGLHIGDDIPTLGSLVLSNGLVVANSVTMFNGTCTIVGGLMSVNAAVIGDFFGDNGQLEVQGGTVTVTNASHSGVINLAGGQIILDGGTILADSLLLTNLFGHAFGFLNNLSGTLRVNGIVLLNNGTVSISGGMSVLASNLVAGTLAGSTGIVEVTAGQLVVTNGVIGIGNDGTTTNGVGKVAHLTVSNGLVLASTILLGSSAGGQGDVTLAEGGTISCPAGTNCLIVINSKGWTNIGGALVWSNGTMECGVTQPGDYIQTNATATFQYVYIGYSDVGTMSMLGGSMDVSSHLIVGHLGPPFSTAVSTGVVWVTGGQLTMTNDYCIVGNSGVGQMTISNGTVTAAEVIVGNSSNPGTLTLAAGTLTVNSLVLTNSGSRFLLSGGWLNAGAIVNSNGQPFVVGNGVDAATCQLQGGVHSFSKGLRIRSAGSLRGCATINGTVIIDTGGAVAVSCGGALTFSGAVTNNGILRAANGSVLELFGPVVNNGVIDLINGGTTNFHSTFINNGSVLDASSVRVSNTVLSGNDVNIRISSVVGHTYQLQIISSLASPSWTNASASQAGTGGVLTFTDPGGATNGPTRFYRVQVGAQ